MKVQALGLQSEHFIPHLNCSLFSYKQYFIFPLDSFIYMYLFINLFIW